MSATGSPYASILIPTHDRASTLPYAVSSALGQSIADIEVIIAGDGCTDAVREIAQALARADSRVRFVDLPKSPLRGAANRDLALRTAAAERIFYSDDDDLLLPQHVETLGAALDTLDIVDTPVVSVDLEGGLHLGLLNSGNALQRRLLAQGSLKGVFDTHFAHRKSVYTERPAAWLAATDHRVVLHMLRGFAADTRLRWETLPRATALSFHGAARAAMPAAARAAELAGWAPKLATRGLEAWILATGGRSVHGLAAATVVADQASSLQEVGALFGLDVQHAPLRAAIDVLHRRRPDLAAAGMALQELLHPVLGPRFPAEYIVSMFLTCFSAGDMRLLINGLRPTCIAALARYHLALRCGEPDEAYAVAQETIEAAGPGQGFFAGASIVSGLAREGMWQQALQWSRRVAPAAPESRHAVPFWEHAQAIGRALDDAPWTGLCVANLERLSGMDH